MTTLLEDPTPVILVGIVTEAVLGIVLLRTGRGVLLWAMGGVLLLMLFGVGLEHLVVTDREEVEATLDDAAAAVAANDRDGVARHIHPSAAATHKWLNWALSRVEFTDVKITHLDVGKVNQLTSPPTVKVHLKGIVHFKDRRGEFPYDDRLVSVTLELRRESDRWLISGYQWHDDPRGSPQ